MKNVRISREGEDIIIRVNAAERHGPSNTGKTIVVGTTGGFVKAPGDDEISISLNVNAKR